MASFPHRSDQEITTAPSAIPGYLLFQRVFFAVCIVLTPLVCILYAILNPTALGAKSGKVALAVNAATNPTVNQIHLALGITLSFLLPLAFLGMAWLAMRRAPWLATIAGLLGLLGWLPWSALIGQEGLAYTMVQMGGGTSFALLWDHFNSDFVIHSYLLIYIIGHLLSTVLLGIALGKTRLIPAWAAWAFALSSPLQIVTFILHLLPIILFAFVLWFLASVPTALTLLRGQDQRIPKDHSV